jgi:hypothetical protein
LRTSSWLYAVSVFDREDSIKLCLKGISEEGCLHEVLYFPSHVWNGLRFSENRYSQTEDAYVFASSKTQEELE